MATIAAKLKTNDADDLKTQWAVEDFAEELSAYQPVTVPRRVLKRLFDTLLAPVDRMSEADQEILRRTIIKLFNNSKNQY